MRQNIMCQKGKCWESEEEKDVHFQEMFGEGNMVKKIEKDLWMKNYYGE
jgi:hypothetical protein